MFGFLQSENKKLRAARTGSTSVIRYTISAKTNSRARKYPNWLDESTNYEAVKTKPADAGKLKLSIEAMEDHMRKVGELFTRSHR